MGSRLRKREAGFVFEIFEASAYLILLLEHFKLNFKIDEQANP